ncbi:MAG: ABC transporter ATP-binding protein [Armatimonadetes bacterium]|nr:ABC transporter ATP-binding protein [Armatimonadota bacterium]
MTTQAALDEPVVALDNVTLGYGPRVVLREVSLTIRRGEFLGLVGPNGAGKTTILRAILGLLKPRSGEIHYAGDGRPRFGYVPQQSQVDEYFPLTALDVVMMAAWPMVGWLRLCGAAARERALWALRTVQAADLAQQLFRDLSGGQKQRVLVARALATGATTLLLDEPTNDMDLASEYELMEVLSRLHREHSMTIVIVSHLLHVVLSYAERILILHEGRLREVTADELRDGRALSEIYNLPVRILSHGSKRAVVVGDGDD